MRKCIVAGCRRLTRLALCKEHDELARAGKPLTRCRCPNAPKFVHAVGCPGETPPMAESDHPLFLELLILIEPEIREGESLLTATRRLVRDSVRLHEITWNREGRDVE
jgi:hypothetical protein